MVEPVTRGLLYFVILSFLPGLAREARAAQAQPDSTVYQVDPSSRLVVKTGKAGLFGFAGHSHVIRAGDGPSHHRLGHCSSHRNVRGEADRFWAKPFSGGPGGTVKVSDRVIFCFDLVGVKHLPGNAAGGAVVRNMDFTGVPGCVDNGKTKAEPAKRPM